MGQNWLKNVENGKYFSETYVAHLDIPSSDDTLVVILTTTRILLVKVLKLKAGWDVVSSSPFASARRCSCDTALTFFSFHISSLSLICKPFRSKLLVSVSPS